MSERSVPTFAGQTDGCLDTSMTIEVNSNMGCRIPPFAEHEFD